MYDLSPPKIYIFDDVFQDERSLNRTRRMLDAIGRGLPSAERVTEADIPEIVRQNNWQTARNRQGIHGEHTDPSLVFRQITFADTPDTSAILPECPPGTSDSLVSNLMGQGGRNIHHESASHGRICRERYQFDSIYGCPHGCKYCHGGKVAVIFTNIEEWIEAEVAVTARDNPWQKVFMFNSCLSDTLCFEPEYGLVKQLAEFYASTPDQYQLIHTKSANVGPLLELGYGGHTIVLWSLTSESVSGILEPRTGSTMERIEAARRCQQAGYPVRFKFKPIVPVRDWRQECRMMVDAVFEKTKPDNLGLCTIAWMEAEEFKRTFDVSLLDPDFLKAMEESAEAMKGIITGPFPHQARAEIYGFYLNEIRKHDKDVPVFLCTESPEMWKDFAPRLGVNPSNYACGCGPQCPPGTVRLESLKQLDVS